MSEAPERSAGAAPSRPLARLFDASPAAQPLVAGLLAWVVTVAPVGYVKHAPWGATLFATLALVALARGAVAEWLLRRRDTAPAPAAVDKNRIVTLGTFALASTVTWLCDPDALTPVRFSASRGVAGVLGWLLFAFACAAPAVEGPSPGGGAARVEAGPRARGRVARGDAIFVGVATLLATLLQAVGWAVASPERAVLVRLVTVTSAVVLLGAIGVLTSARHGGREAPPDPKRRGAPARRRVPLGWLVALALLLAAGVLYALTPGGDL